jgi:hypothetical protein
MRRLLKQGQGGHSGKAGSIMSYYERYYYQVNYFLEKQALL